MFSTFAEYLFNIRPHSFVVLGTVFLISAIVALVCAIALEILKEKVPTFYDKLASKTQKFLIWYGVVSLVFYFLRTQRIVYFSMRIWLWVWIIGIIVLAAIFLLKEYKKIPVRRDRLEQEEKKKRYFET